MIEIVMHAPNVGVGETEGAKVLTVVDGQSGITVVVPLPDEAAKQIGAALQGQAPPKVQVVPAGALSQLKSV